ncbi:uncharacterized protein [Nicotiana sylvestris]|uniref:uncharacterized protein n=1 Tax=Nicotiana sylvestris TaxID=4096 RepID=UPI00388CE782
MSSPMNDTYSSGKYIFKGLYAPPIEFSASRHGFLEYVLQRVHPGYENCLSLVCEVKYEVGVDIFWLQFRKRYETISKISEGLVKAIEKSRDPTPSELHGHDEKSFVSERSRLVHEKYQQILQQQTQTQSDIDQSLAFYQATGGEKKRRIYGLRSQEKYFYGPNLRASSRSDASSSAAPPNAQSAPMENLDELVMRLIPALTDHMVPVLTDHMLPVLAERVRGLIASPSHVQDNHTDHPSAMTPPLTTNINEGHASLSDDDLHSPVSQ